MSECLIFSESPLTNLVAEVLCENDCSYLYVYKKDQFLKKEDEQELVFNAQWIKNHVFVPDSYSPEDDMEKGLQPKVCTTYCKYPDDFNFFDEEDLEIVWGEEGFAAGLYYKNELICVILDIITSNMHTYTFSKYWDTKDLFPLNDEMVTRMEKARQFWKQDFGKIWKDYSEAYLGELEKKFGKHIKYFAILTEGNFHQKHWCYLKKTDTNMPLPLA